MRGSSLCLSIVVFYTFLYFCGRAIGVVAFSQKLTTDATFWDSQQLLSTLPDPPSRSVLNQIKQSPHRGGFEPVWDIGWYKPHITIGYIPKDLVGTLSINGPGRIRIGDRQFGHWFDGDGYITHLVLDGRRNSAYFSGQYVETGRYLSQKELDRQKGRGSGDYDSEHDRQEPLAFSGAWTPKGRGKWYENVFQIPQNPANTATMWVPPKFSEKRSTAHSHPRLFALCEGGHPFEVDPKTLRTVGGEKPFRSGNGDEEVASFFSAHFSRCALSGDIFNHGYVLRPGRAPQLNVMRLSSGAVLLDQKSTELPFDTFVHDSALTSKHVVYFTPPWRVPAGGIIRALLGQCPLGKLFGWAPDEGAWISIHSRSDLSLKRRVRLPHLMTLYHIVDAFDDDGDGGVDEIIRVRVAELQRPDRVTLEEQFSDPYGGSPNKERQLYCRLREYTIRMSGNGDPDDDVVVTDRDVIAPSGGAALCEFPVVNSRWNPTRRRRFCWTSAASHESTPWLDGVQKLDMEKCMASQVASFGDGSFAGAPTFVPRKNAESEDDGYLISTVYRSNEHRSDVVILNAATMELIAMLRLEHHVPYQFHGEFVEGFLAHE